MQWLMHLISLDTSRQLEIHSQIKGLDPEAAVQSGLLKGALRESLRLYPVAPFITRYLASDVVIDGYQLHAGVSICLLH